jgi:NhaA family Na+:H+ antiporter
LSQSTDPATGGEPTRARQKVVRSLVRPVQAFISEEVLSGVVLLVAAVVALAWANSPWDGAYRDLFTTDLSIDIGVLSINLDLHGWINDGLMTVFFFVIGLEIKRELIRGELARREKALLPIVAAFGGMIVPALIYTAFNAGGAGGHGWGIPMATDIAFALGVLALLGRRLPSQLRVFLLTIAVVDDIGSIVVIAVFYSHDIDLAWLATAFALLAAVYAMRRYTIRHYAAYIVAGCCLWLATFESGVTATISGVVLGLLTPLDPSYRRQPEAAESPLEHLERLVHPYSSLLIVPIFAIANAGVSLNSDTVGNPLTNPVVGGIVFGCMIGKPVGIVLSAWITVKSGLGSLPTSTTWLHIIGVGILGGIGFTVALFVNGLAFQKSALADDGSLGIMIAAVIAGLAGYAVLRFLGGQTEESDGAATDK